jgi:TPR repeat protein
MRTILYATALVFVVIPAGVFAQDREKAMAAYAKGDFVTAMQEWRLLADSGDTSAQSLVGDLYYNGVGAPQDYAEAAKWFLLAAEKGSPFAQARIGMMYSYGEGVSQSDVNAVSWFDLAAKQGYAPAQIGLGMMHQHGSDDVKDNVSAHMWFNIASVNKSKNGKRLRDEVAEEMTGDQISEAQRKARICMESEYQECG